MAGLSRSIARGRRLSALLRGEVFLRSPPSRPMACADDIRTLPLAERKRV